MGSRVHCSQWASQSTRAASWSRQRRFFTCLLLHRRVCLTCRWEDVSGHDGLQRRHEKQGVGESSCLKSLIKASSEDLQTSCTAVQPRGVSFPFIRYTEEVSKCTGSDIWYSSNRKLIILMRSIETKMFCLTTFNRKRGCKLQGVCMQRFPFEYLRLKTI